MCLEEPMASPSLTPCAHLMCRECLRDCLQREACCPVSEKEGRQQGAVVGGQGMDGWQASRGVSRNKRGSFLVVNLPTVNHWVIGVG